MPDKLDILRKYWGYDAFRPLQAEIIDSVLAGHDTLGLLPTGGGKSLTFQVPALLLPGLTIVVTPLISLMKDQVDNLLQRGIRAYCLHSGMSRAEARLAMDRCRLGKAKMLYVSPERLGSERFTDELRFWQVSMIVVDEAHCISQWGYDFRPSYLGIRRLRTLFPDAPVLALTASATPQVAADIMAQLEFRPGWQKFAKSFARPNISYVVRYTETKGAALQRILEAVPGTAIVYARSRKRCAEMCAQLQAAGIPAEFYHAGLDPQEKSDRQNAWKEGAARVMVATNAFGMGIDKPDVRTVVHIDLPSSLEEYYQEAGRAGRDGLPSYAVVLASKADKGLLTRRLSESFPPLDYVGRVYEAACNFLSLAVGEGYDKVYEFDTEKFCRTFGLQPATAVAALRILGRAGYMEYIDDAQSRSRVMVIADKRDFYSLQLDAVTDAVFCELQREYAGLFADYVRIDERILARRAGVTPDQVYQAMLLLSRMKVVSYVPKSGVPYVYLPTSREEPRYLVIPKAAYEDRRRAMEERIEAMKRYVYDVGGCRVSAMLAYFGQTDEEPCGTCDVCRARKGAPKPPPELPQAILAAVQAAPSGISVASLIAAVAASADSSAEVMAAIRALADEGRLTLSGTLVSPPKNK